MVGIDIYVGSLNRYYAEAWRTSVQEFALVNEVPIEIVRPGETRERPVGLDPSAIHDVVSGWQLELGRSLGIVDLWDDVAESPYATNKPGWKGLGGLILLAAYAVHPDLDPNRARRRFRKKPVFDNAREYDKAPAFVAAQSESGDFPSILAQASWWMPIDTAPTLFEGPRPDGGVHMMSRVSQLIHELRLLAALYGVTDEVAVALRDQGPGAAENPYENGIFGIAALLPMAEYARQTNSPLILDF